MNDAKRKQFDELKLNRPDAILLFRVGDFYETYEEDAVSVSEVLGITLTKDSDGCNMAGFPHHALDTYLPKLVRAGKRVAICDQLDDPETKKLAQRGITDPVTPQEPEPETETDSSPATDDEPETEREPVSFCVDTDELADALKLLERVVPRNPNLPVLTSYKMELADDYLTITATDTDIWLTMQVIATGLTGNTVFLLPAAGLAKLVAGLKDRNDELEVEVGSRSITLKHSAGYVTIDLADSATTLPDAPATEFIPRHFSPSLDQTDLFSWLNTFSQYTADDDLRPTMSGVRIDCDDKRTELVATDGRVLCLRTYPCALPEPFAITIPVAACRLIAALPDHDLTFAVSPDGEWLRLSTEGITMTVRLIPGRYPAYRQAIPPLDGYSTAVLPREPFTAALQRVVATRSESQCANTRIRQGRVEIREAGCTSGMTEAVKAECQTECSLGINAQYALNLMRLTEGLDGENVTMYYQAANKPVMWSVGAFTLLQMPMRFDESLYDDDK